jgi:hypothetical protein
MSAVVQYKHEVGSLQQKLSGLTREELQRALGVKPMDKSSTYRGVSKKKGRWEAKVMLNRKWAYRCGCACVFVNVWPPACSDEGNSQAGQAHVLVYGLT